MPTFPRLLVRILAGVTLSLVTAGVPWVLARELVVEHDLAVLATRWEAHAVADAARGRRIDAIETRLEQRDQGCHALLEQNRDRIETLERVTSADTATTSSLRSEVDATRQSIGALSSRIETLSSRIEAISPGYRLMPGKR